MGYLHCPSFSCLTAETFLPLLSLRGETSYIFVSGSFGLSPLLTIIDRYTEQKPAVVRRELFAEGKQIGKQSIFMFGSTCSQFWSSFTTSLAFPEQANELITSLLLRVSCLVTTANESIGQRASRKLCEGSSARPCHVHVEGVHSSVYCKCLCEKVISGKRTCTVRNFDLEQTSETSSGTDVCLLRHRGCRHTCHSGSGAPTVGAAG
uniref:NAD_binding_1 domain-containing protein n=1 Tax=Steinernema glaseri TaxID=37863 RepID=A0A1I7XZX2_9BILA